MNAKKIRPEKEAIVSGLRKTLEDVSYIVLVNGSGLNMEATDDLRARLANQDADMQVVKNDFVRIATQGTVLEEGCANLEGPTMLIIGRGDPSAIAKEIKKFHAEKGVPVVKGGQLGTQVLTAADVEAIASIPPREVVLAQVVGTIAAPMTQLVGVMNQKVLSLLYVLKAAADKKAA
jgi:large subunit ribosomal protein L10